MAELTKPTTVGITHNGEILHDYLERNKSYDVSLFGVIYNVSSPSVGSANADAIDAAIIATGGRIKLSGKCFVSRTIYIRGYDYPVVSFELGGELIIDQSFTFKPGTRGILCYHECNNPTTNNPVITGARLYNPTAPEPWQDGDAGVEYLVCTGKCKTSKGRLKNFMTWGVIHSEYESYDVSGTDISDCMIQSGIGGISGKHASVSDLTLNRIGLYGVELETRQPLLTASVHNVLVKQSQKGVMAYDSVRRPSISSVTAIDCVEGVSMINNTGNSGEGGSVRSSNMINCRVSMLCKNISKSRWLGNTARRFDDEVFTRVRAQDFIREISNSVAWMVNEASATSLLSVGSRIMCEDEVVRTVTEVSYKVDPIFRDMIGFKTQPAMVDSLLHHAVFQPITPGFAGMVMYGGLANDVQSNSFGYLENAFLSYGDHSQLMVSKNNYENVGTIFANGQDGTLSDCKLIVRGEDCTGLTEISNHPKFNPALNVCTHLWLGGVAVGHEHIISIGKGKISKIVCVLDPSVTASGTIVLRINGVDTIVGFNGSPPVGVANVNISVSGSLRIQLTDTAGDIKGYGFSLKIYGGYTED